MKKLKEALKYGKKGITLISLVVTIVVLLILAGVTIATLTGNNGILTKAQQAKTETEEAQKNEENTLGSYEDKINEYAGIDWDTALANAQKHPDQKTSTAIGIGTNGRAVNMDLWEYTLLDDGTYGLNTRESLNTDSSQGVTSGYKGEFTEDGQIEATIPQYISEDNGKTFKEVTDLKWLFYNCSQIKIAPNIPTTIKKMNYTFRKCVNLKETPLIPDSVIEMSKSFQECTGLERVISLSNNLIDLSYAFDQCTNLKSCVDIPNKVENLDSTFKDCINLEVVPELSKNVTNMYRTFINCRNLKNIYMIIPSSVTNMNRTFYGCENLTGEIVINANLNGNIIFDDKRDWGYIFAKAVNQEGSKIVLSGTCKMLSNIVLQSNNPNITLKQ